MNANAEAKMPLASSFKSETAHHFQQERKSGKLGSQALATWKALDERPKLPYVITQEGLYLPPTAYEPGKGHVLVGASSHDGFRLVAHALTDLKAAHIPPDLVGKHQSLVLQVARFRDELAVRAGDR